MCFRMHFAKDPVVINAASAAVRQLEDGVFSTELTVVPSSGGRPSPRSAPPTLRPCAADAYLLFKVSSQHPSSRSSTGVGSPTDRPYFPIAMRLVRIILCLISLYHQLLPTECEIFLSSLIKFVDVDRRGWQRALSLEALHRVVVRPDIVRLDSLERHEAGVLPEGYVVSRANCALVDFVQAVYAAVDALSLQEQLEDLVFDSSSALHEVVVSGTPCPSSVVVPDKWNDQVMLTSRNLQASSILLSSICAHASYLDELWHLSLLTCQHIAWLLGIRPSSTGIFAREKAEVDQQSMFINCEVCGFDIKIGLKVVKV
ncbi:hypothetical protein TELCIR_19319 [Teladorsagia circumcincta]|uniref:Uncharacterized protein n=1 Tax=Teladorsagia circumcincta TaxID=45464 RepID=A0A2G9TMR4_TELCI|nr:hypothetical protein TELCIR_19319 [Teladorsagia circumcincta]